MGCGLAPPSSLLINCKTAAGPFSRLVGDASVLDLVVD